MLDQPYMTDLIEANSMGHEPHKIHIYSASWGPTDDGKTVDGPRNATMRAIVQGVNEVSVWRGEGRTAGSLIAKSLFPPAGTQWTGQHLCLGIGGWWRRG